MSFNRTSYFKSFDEIKAAHHITESGISSVVAMLPVSFQSGIKPIQFLRRSISLHSLRQGILISESEPRSLLEDAEPALDEEPLVTEILDQDDIQPELNSKALAPRPMSRVLCSELRDDQQVRAASGIHWPVARQGASLLSISIDRGKPAVVDDDIMFERKAYIDGLTYLLKALPQDLDACELRRIESVLPKGVTQHHSTTLPGAGSSAGRFSRASRHSQPRSILHRSVQTTVVNMIFLWSFLMPYLMYLLKYAARMERKYKLSETVVSHGMEFVNSIGKQSASLTESMYQMNDGKVGQALTGALVWTVDGLAQGISDGVGEGLSIVSSRGDSVRHGNTYMR
ncbi:hypothetical protein BGZ63DRAFT_353034 [Mariannaea sp. PMI_226]|nr:hypothetical protein BGZ63DRAFT_353034 [Mariannaea sp. PMI_226]